MFGRKTPPQLDEAKVVAEMGRLRKLNAKWDDAQAQRERCLSLAAAAATGQDAVAFLEAERIWGDVQGRIVDSMLSIGGAVHGSPEGIEARRRLKAEGGFV